MRSELCWSFLLHTKWRDTGLFPFPLSAFHLLHQEHTSESGTHTQASYKNGEPFGFQMTNDRTILRWVLARNWIYQIRRFQVDVRSHLLSFSKRGVESIALFGIHSLTTTSLPPTALFRGTQEEPRPKQGVELPVVTTCSHRSGLPNSGDYKENYAENN